MDDRFKARIEQIYADLDRYSYYELLNLTPDATPDQIRAAFHRMALSVHPDRYQQSVDQELRHKIYTIYKRMTEGYRVLMEPRDRRAYDEELPGGQMRLVRTASTIPRRGSSLCWRRTPSAGETSRAPASTTSSRWTSHPSTP
jgi:curved DNA-binding protein CbpA